MRRCCCVSNGALRFSCCVCVPPDRMSSYHPRTIVPPPRRSPASSAVAQALRNANRPRSAGSLFSNSLASYSPSAYTPSSSYLTSSAPLYHHKSSLPSTSHYLNPSYKSSYSRPAASRVSPSRFSSNMGPRSGSLSSLSALSTKSDASEGYAVNAFFHCIPDPGYSILGFVLCFRAKTSHAWVRCRVWRAASRKKTARWITRSCTNRS